MRGFGRIVAALFLALTAGTAAAQGQLNIVCSVQAPWCEAVANAFQKETGIRVLFTQKSAGEAMAQVAAEKANPKIDLWYTGTGDPHLQAAEMGLTEEYKSPMLPQLYDWAVRQAEQSKFHTVGVYTGALGIAYNPEILAKKQIAPPKCWEDLGNPIYKDEVQIANPNASGTAYSTIATLVQIFGEDKAFELLKAWHKNINNYPRSGVGPVRAVGRGETAIAVTFLHDGMTEIATSEVPRSAAAPTTAASVGLARSAAPRAPMTVPTPSTAMRKPASPASPPKVLLASNVRNVGKL